LGDLPRFAAGSRRNPFEGIDSFDAISLNTGGSSWELIRRWNIPVQDLKAGSRLRLVLWRTASWWRRASRPEARLASLTSMRARRAAILARHDSSRLWQHEAARATISATTGFLAGTTGEILRHSGGYSRPVAIGSIRASSMLSPIGHKRANPVNPLQRIQNDRGLACAGIGRGLQQEGAIHICAFLGLLQHRLSESCLLIFSNSLR
jgi:hypothetical protein